MKGYTVTNEPKIDRKAYACIWMVIYFPLLIISHIVYSYENVETVYRSSYQNT